MQFKVNDDNVSLSGALLADHSDLLTEVLRGMLRRVPQVVLDGSGIQAWDREGLETFTSLLDVRPGSVHLVGFQPAMQADVEATIRHANVFSRLAG